MKHRSRIVLLASLVTLLAFVFSGGMALFQGSVEVAFAQDSKRAHPEVQLRDYDGKAIDPGSDNPQPYSPKLTCGGCHSYDTISQGYHFQMGAEKVSDDFGEKTGRPWILSDGMSGKQIHMSYNALTKKHNTSEAEVGLTAYQFAQTCGSCHAGGGLMERDRDGQRYDLRLANEPGLAASFDGDYHKSTWDKSGVVEIDCLMCHYPNYDGKARSEQLSNGNYRWAASVGAGLATVEGSVKEGQSPKNTYTQSAFSPSGSINLKISSPQDRNCLLCHAEAQTKKRGHVYDGRNDDVHTNAGITCVACHTAGLDHQIRKAKSQASTVRDDLDDESFSCAGCHMGDGASKKPAHKLVPESHMRTIACVTCHVRDTNVAAVHTVDTTAGKTVSVPTVRTARNWGESGSWTPAYFRLNDGKIYSGNALLPAFWGNKIGNAIHPLYLRETARAYELVKDKIKDDDGDGRPEANTEAEITAMLEATREVLADGRFKDISPAYVKGDKVWQLINGKLVATTDHPQAKPLNWSFSHNVSPAGKALGAGGCMDCHGADSTFFQSTVVVDPYDESGKQVTVPMWRYTGVEESAIRK